MLRPCRTCCLSSCRVCVCIVGCPVRRSRIALLAFPSIHFPGDMRTGKVPVAGPRSFEFRSRSAYRNFKTELTPFASTTARRAIRLDARHVAARGGYLDASAIGAVQLPDPMQELCATAFGRLQRCVTTGS